MYLTLLRELLGGTAALATLPGSVELGGLTFAGMLPPIRKPATCADAEKQIRLAVVIPAHNERDAIGACLDSILADNRTVRAAIVVVADNCTDETAAIARGRGAEVLERFSSGQRGKGFALDHAFRLLAARRYDAYIIVDADSVVAPGFLAAFRDAFAGGAAAAQCAYLVSNRDGGVPTRLQDLALRAFNQLRPRGRDRLGLSAGILGNGFGLRRTTLECVPYNAHSVVEDLEYHLALVAHGCRVEFVESTAVYGAMPASGKGRVTQRARWEGGRLRMLREHAPRLAASLLRGQLSAAEPLLDLLLLPLGFHAPALAIAMCAASPLFRGFGIAGLAILLLHVAAAVLRGPSVRHDLRALVAAPAYILWKLRHLPATVAASASRAAWVRTERAAAQENL